MRPWGKTEQVGDKEVFICPRSRINTTDKTTDLQSTLSLSQRGDCSGLDVPRRLAKEE